MLRALAALLLGIAAREISLAAEPPAPLQLNPGELQLVPSFHACSYYFRPTGGAGGPLQVEYRAAGAAGWQRAFPPVTDQPAGIWKGSLFDLNEDTGYDVRVVRDGSTVAAASSRTWSSRPPIAKVIDLSTLPGAQRGIVITDQGSPTGWIKYTAPAGWRMERAASVDDAQLAAITFRNARHVILENVTVVGGARHGILIENSDSVRILNCDISGWGRVGVQQFTNTGTRGKYVDRAGATINYDAGVSIDRSARTVVERCYVHDPRHRANSWMFSHPAGPTAVHANSTRGGTVLRWNDFVGSDAHRWNDVIEASSNSAADGGFFRDSDIAGNFLAFGNDDGVELEGGGMNVRFYGNKIEGTTCGVSTGACILGPQFVYGNVIANPGDEAGLALMFFKNSHGAEQGGKRHFLNNTLYGSRASAYGSYGKLTPGSERIGYLRNNVFVASGARLPAEWGRREDFDSDLFWHDRNPDIARAYLAAWQAQGQERNAVAADPQLIAPERGDYRLQPNSPARGRAAAVDGFAITGHDLGALQAANEVPARPLALVVAPRQLTFARSDRVVTAEVKLSLPSDAPAAVPFAIRQNRAFRWFEVSPASGVVAPGKSVTLTVRIDGPALRGRPMFKGAFLVRTPEGLSRPVSVYAAANFTEDLRPAEAPNTIYIEAEVAVAGAAARDTKDPGAFGGKYVALSARDRAALAETRFSVRQPGRYALLLRAAIGPDPEGRRETSISLDGAEPARAGVASAYNWSTGETHFRAIFLHDLGELAAGPHELRVRMAAGELNVNELIVTDHPEAFFIDHWQREIVR